MNLDVTAIVLVLVEWLAVVAVVGIGLAVIRRVLSAGGVGNGSDDD